MGLLAIVAALDQATGNQVSFSLFYIAPIAMGGWFASGGFAIVIALAASVLWTLDRAGSPGPAAIFYWNAAVESGIFLGFALGVIALRREFDRRAQVSAELQTAYRRLDEEMELVGALQRGMLPARVPELDRAVLLSHYLPCTQSGGDYFDFFPLSAGRTGILIADAVGHGAPAAVLMAMMRILLHSRDLSAASPGDVLWGLNRDFLFNLPEGQFITACYATFDPNTRVLEYSIAGHNPPLLLSATSGEIREFVNPCGLPLGVLDHVSFVNVREALDTGDTVLFYTDGLTEARDARGREFGVAGIAELLRGHSAARPDHLLQRIIEAHATHLNGAHTDDDTTIVLLRAEADVPHTLPAAPLQTVPSRAGPPADD